VSRLLDFQASRQIVPWWFLRVCIIKGYDAGTPAEILRSALLLTVTVAVTIVGLAAAGLRVIRGIMMMA
jgi:hypothetical protein